MELTCCSDGTYPRANKLADGSLIGAYTAFADGNNVITLVKSSDNGTTWTHQGTAAQGVSSLTSPSALRILRCLVHSSGPLLRTLPKHPPLYIYHKTNPPPPPANQRPRHRQPLPPRAPLRPAHHRLPQPRQRPLHRRLHLLPHHSLLLRRRRPDLVFPKPSRPSRRPNNRSVPSPISTLIPPSPLSHPPHPSH